MVESTSLIAAIASTACCCLAVFLVAIVGLSFWLRPKKPAPEDIAGVPPAPGRGVQTQASLTNMGHEAPPTED